MTHPECHRSSYLRNFALSVLCFLLLAGCAAKRDSYKAPAIDLPGQYAKAPPGADAAASGNASGRPARPVSPPAPSSPLGAALAEWWRLLGSKELNGLMDRALANNPDLRIAALRIAQSKARLDQAGADKAPTITMPVQVKNEYPESGIGRGNPNGNNKSRITHQISLRGDWRPDIWGETHSLYESAELQLLRATYQRDDMQRNVVADVAVNYMEYLSLNDRLRVARATEKSLGEMLASVNARLEAGDATITEMEQQKAAVYSVKATIPVLEQQREVVLNRLASLAGSAPVELKLSDGGMDSARFPPVLPGVPSALLLRRPDVRAVEARLLAADADIDVARARVLPPLDLTAQAGYGSMHMSKLFMPQSLFWSAIANLSVTLFDSGKRSSEVEFAQAVHEELTETYVRVIYDAVREVDDSLSAIGLMGKRLEAQGVAADSALRAWNFSQEAFMAGAVDYLVVLDTQRTYQRNLDDWYSVRMERYRSLVNLFSALGGGVSGGDDIPGEGAQPGKEAGRIDWAGNSLRSGAWLAEISGVYDRGAVLPAWRDLNTRFPRQVENLALLPQRQGQVNAAGKERASWYRLFVATFPGKKMAEEFCAALRAGQQRCGVVQSQSLAGKDGFAAPPDRPRSVAAGAAAATAGTASPGGNDRELGSLSGSSGAMPANGAQTIQLQAGEQAAGAAHARDEQGAKAPAGIEATSIPMAAPGPVAVPMAAEASKPQPMINAGDEADVLKSVQDWAAAWSSKNMRDYLAAYTPDFKQGGMNRDAWEKRRMKLIGARKAVEVALSDIGVSVHDDSRATVSFTQDYRSDRYRDQVEKTLRMVKQSGHWLIAEERIGRAVEAVTGAPAAPRPDQKRFEGMDWTDQQSWLVEMSDTYDRRGITAAWLDLLARYPAQMKNRAILLRRQGGMGDAGEEHASRYQLFIARFSEKQLAEELCAVLRAGRQRCDVVPSQSLAGEGSLNVPPVAGQDGSGQDTGEGKP